MSFRTMFSSMLALVFALALALPAMAATPVNINKADAAAIAQALDGIGQSKAEAIVAYRDQHGPFKTVEELAEVKGIGAATIERNRDAILFIGPDDAAMAKAGVPLKATPKKQHKQAAARE